MLSMTQINLIRTLYYEQGKSISEISRENGWDRKTVSKYIEQESFNDPPPDTKKAGPGRPSRLTQFTEIIDSWLLEDLQHKRKQRHTSKRVYDRLLQEYADTFDCCYKTVANYVSSRRKNLYKDNSCYVKLQHIPGEAQVDFGSADFYESSKLYSGKYLNVSFPHSNQGYLQLFKGENQECLFEGLTAIFNYIGGVPTRMWFDNTSTIVTKILKNGGRNLTDDFVRFKNHYLFESVFCNKGKGNEKGNVENKVGYHRRNLMVPVPSFENLEQYNTGLLELCKADGQRAHYNKDIEIADLHKADIQRLIPLPNEPFNSDKYIRLKVNTYGRFTLNKGLHEYTAVPKLAGEYATIRLTSSTVNVLDSNLKEVLSHSRLYGEYRQSSIQWLPFLNQLAAKPNAIKYSGIMEALPEPLKNYLELSKNSEKSRLLSALAKIGEKAGFDKALEAASEATKLKAFDPDSLLTIYTYQNMADMQLGESVVPEGLPEMKRVVPVIEEFDAFLKKRGASVS